jgi:hypothetical protein
VIGAVSSQASLAALVSTSFQAWEIRGRGWQLADYPCELEPPYRPFFLLPQQLAALEYKDDGKRHTLVSGTGAFIKSATKSLFQKSPEPIADFVEHAPFPYTPYTHHIVSFAIRVPSDYKHRADTVSQLLLALGQSSTPTAFEFIGHGGQVHIQVSVNHDDAHAVRSLIESYVSQISLVESGDLLANHFKSLPRRMVVDFGLSEEYFLPLKSDQAIDPLHTLIPALANLQPGEMLCMQCLFQRVKNPWEQAIRDAVGESENDCIYADATHFVKYAKDKTTSPLFATCIRVAIASSEDGRLKPLARSVMPFVRGFDAPGSNLLIPLENDDYPDSQHEEALLDRTSFRTGMLLSANELQAIAHFPDASITSDALLRDSKRTRKFAPHSPLPASDKLTVLGRNRFLNEEGNVFVSIEERLAHMHVVGASGTGKSTLLTHLIQQDIDKGYGVAVLDPSGDLIDDIAKAIPEHRKDDVILFDPSDGDYPIGLNLFEAKSELEKNTLCDDIVSIFERLSSNWGDTMSTVLSNAVLAAIEHRNGGTLLELRRLLIDDAFRKQFITGIDDEEIRYFWQKQYPLIGSRSVGPLLSRLDAFLRPKIIRNLFAIKHGPFNVSKAIEHQSIILAKLSHGLIGEQNSYLLGSLLISKIQQAAMARQAKAKEERQPYFLYIDECQNFVTPSVTSILSGTRKYALGLTVAHQHLAQLDTVPAFQKALLGNAHTRIVYRVSSDDAKSIAHDFEHFEANDFTNLARAEAIGRIGGAGTDFSLRTLPPKKPRDDADEMYEQIIESSRARFATKLSDIPRSLPASEEKADTTATQAHAESTQEANLSNVDQLPTRDSEPLASAPPSSVPTSSSSHPPPPIPLYKEIDKPIPRDTGRSMTFEPIDEDFGKGGREHRYIQQLIKRLGEDRGYKSTIEYTVDDGRVDVVLAKGKQQYAFEISVTNTATYELGNLEKCLRSNFNKVFFVCPDPKRRAKVEKLLAEKQKDSGVVFVAPDAVVREIELLTETQASRETIVRGYRVKVNRQAISSTELAGKRAVIAEVIAKSMMR